MERALRSYLGPALGYLLVLEGLLAAAILFWPSFRDNVESLKAIAGPLPMLRDMVTQIGAAGVAAYVHGQHFFKGCNTLGTAAAILFAMSAVAGEAHRGTLELWLARPFSRPRLLLERYFAGALALVLPVFLSTASVPWLLGFVGESMALGPLMLCAAHQSLFLLALYSATFLCSTLASRPILIALWMIFFTTLEFSLYLVKTLTDYSIFRLTDIETFARITSRGALAPAPTLGLALLSLALTAASLHAFARRVP